MDIIPEIGCEVEVETSIESEGEAIIRELGRIVQEIKEEEERLEMENLLCHERM